MKHLIRRVKTLFLFLYYLDCRSFFPAMKLLFYRFIYYLYEAVNKADRASILFKDKTQVVSLKKIKFVIRAAPGDLGYICECLFGRAYEAQESFIPRDGNVCLDIGATIGSCALSWHTHNPSGLIICIEPHPYSFQRLLKNIELNKCRNIQALQIAISNQNGRIEMFTNEGSAMISTDPSWGNIKHSVEANTLDYLIEKKGIGKIDLCKIDVEGLELEVLSGAQKSLKLIERLIIEYHTPELKKEVIKILEKNFTIVKETQSDRYSGLIFAQTSQNF